MPKESEEEKCQMRGSNKNAKGEGRKKNAKRRVTNKNAKGEGGRKMSKEREDEKCQRRGPPPPPSPFTFKIFKPVLHPPSG